LVATEPTIYDANPVSETVHISVKAPPSVEHASKSSSSRIKSADYRAWDKLDIESELEKIDLSNPVREPARITPLVIITDLARSPIE
jgi:hypothetical protein